MFLFPAVLCIPLLVVGCAALYYLTPGFNRLFSVIWQDPTERQRAEIIKRLSEHHIDGRVPKETAVLLTASEFNTTGENLLQAAEMFSAADMSAVLRGRRGVINMLRSKVIKAMRVNAGGVPRKRKLRPQVDEVPGSVEEHAADQELEDND